MFIVILKDDTVYYASAATESNGQVEIVRHNESTVTVSKADVESVEKIMTTLLYKAGR